MSQIALPKIDKSILIRKDEIVKKLSKIINSDNILSEADEVRPYETDALSVYTQTPLAVVLPENTQEVSEILKYCYKENIKDRINKVAENEIDSCVVCSKEPIAINEIVANGQKNRAHFISLLYSCKISKEYRINNGGLESNHPGFLKWHNKCPSNLLSWHEIYRKYM